MNQSKDYQKILSVTAGVTLILAWTLLVLHIESTTISYTQNPFQDPLLAWINLGPVPLFLGLGFYYFMRPGGSPEKREAQFSALKGIFAAFILWTGVILIEPSQAPNNFNIYPVIGGYLLMIVLAQAFRGRLRLFDS